MPEPARTVRVERYGDGAVRVLVDGKEIPFVIDGTVQTVIGDGYPRGITVMIPAETVEVIDSSTPKVTPEKAAFISDHLASKAPPSSWRPGR